MKREELTAILAAILHEQAIDRINKTERDGATAEGIIVAAVDRAQLIIEESFKPPEQRAQEKEARAVAKRLQEKERDMKEGDAVPLNSMLQGQFAQMQTQLAAQAKQLNRGMAGAGAVAPPTLTQTDKSNWETVKKILGGKP